MFCKWCGNTIKTTDEKCAACGRETPPLSDCGGFYNLKQPAVLPVENKVAEPDPEVMELRQQNAAIRMEADRRQKRLLILSVVLAVALVVMLILYITKSGNEGPGPQTVPQDDGQAVATESTAPASTTAPTETTTAEAKRPEPLFAEVTLLKNADGALTATPGGSEASRVTNQKDDEITVEFCWAKVSEETTGAAENAGEFDFEKADKVELTVKWHPEFKENIRLMCSTEEMTRFTGEKNLSYSWEWRREANEDWMTVEIQSEEKGRVISLEDLQAAKLTGDVQLRCVIDVMDENGAVLTITLNGFLLHMEEDGCGISFAQEQKETSN